MNDVYICELEMYKIVEVFILSMSGWVYEIRYCKVCKVVKHGAGD